MTHRDPHRRTPVNSSASGLRSRVLSPIIVRILFTVLALLAWIFVVMPAFAQDATETPLATPAVPETHVVQAGETLSEIAKQHGLIVEQLMRLNGIPNPDAIFVGQELRLPLLDRPAGVTIHVVRSGESLSVIAKQYGVSMSILMAENGIRDANNIVSGMELTIPDVTPTPESVAAASTQVSGGSPADAATAGIIGEPVVMMSVVTMPATPTLIVVPTSTPIAPTPVVPASVVPATATLAAGPVPDATLESGLWVHRVKPGETASEIAKQYGVPLANLLRVNGIADANLIRSGAELVIPGSTGWALGVGAPAASDPASAESSGVPVVGEPVIVEAMTPTPTDAAATEAAATEASATEASATEASATEAVATEAAAEIPATESPATEVAATPTASPEPLAADPAAAQQDQPTPAPMSERPAASLNRTYTIVYGDTLPGIALRFGVDATSLARLNDMETSDSLRAGQSLLLPATDRELRVVTDAQEYVVQPGDSLSEIAKANGISLAELMTANRIVNPNIVSVGERLEIPGRALTGDGPLPRVGPARSGYYFYTVRSGDTLSELAQNLNSTEIALMEYNNISDVATIFNGMELRVPFGAPPLPKRTPPVPLSGSAFLVSLSRQQCWVFSGREVRYAWNCSTGYGQWRTRTGSFAVQSKIEMAKSNVWRLDMPYWLGIYDVGAVENGIHGLPISWRTGRKIWTELIGEPATFGCAMLGDEDALTLFNLAYIGMPVHIIQ